MKSLSRWHKFRWEADTLCLLLLFLRSLGSWEKLLTVDQGSITIGGSSDSGAASPGSHSLQSCPQLHSQPPRSVSAPCPWVTPGQRLSRWAGSKALVQSWTFVKKDTDSVLKYMKGKEIYGRNLQEKSSECNIEPGNTATETACRLLGGGGCYCHTIEHSYEAHAQAHTHVHMCAHTRTHTHWQDSKMHCPKCTSLSLL